MKATTKNNDLTGSVSVDLNGGHLYSLDLIAQDLGIDTNKFKPLGLSLNRESSWHISFFCENVDYLSNNRAKYLKISVDKEISDPLKDYFSSSEIVLFLNDPVTNIEKNEDYVPIDSSAI